MQANHDESVAIEALETITVGASKIKAVAELLAAAARDGAEASDAFEWAAVIVDELATETEKAGETLYAPAVGRSVEGGAHANAA